jgi:predicted N-acetyltransferase YhbS
MITLREEHPCDIAAREALLDASFGDERFEKTCERLREGRKPAEALSLVLEMNGAIIGTVRCWHVSAGPNRPALLLGPIAVDRRYQRLGLGARLMREALARAKALGHRAVLLVGDAPYYARLGFTAELTRGLRLPGPYERERFLALELVAGALRGAHGLITATGEREKEAGLTALVNANGNKRRPSKRAA